MKRTFDFGKVDYSNGTSVVTAKRNRVTVEVKYEKRGDEKVFSACGNIWNIAGTDVLCGGQCLDTIAQYVHTPLFNEIYRLWKIYHLNNAHSECEHQRELGWVELAKKEVPIYTFKLTNDAARKREHLKRRILDAAKNGKSWETNETEQLLLSLDYSIKSDSSQLSSSLAEYYKLDSTELKAIGWLHPEEHSEGILCKPCPVCGYKYGTAWNYMPIPKEDEEIIYKILES